LPCDCRITGKILSFILAQTKHLAASSISNTNISKKVRKQKPEGHMWSIHAACKRSHMAPSICMVSGILK